MKILLVEDAPDVIEAIQIGMMLRFREVEILDAGNGDLALEMVEHELPDIVLLDIGLPGMNGFDVLREIRAFSDVPVIMLTAQDTTTSKIKGLELGADDYITKPFDHLELLARIRAVLRRLDMPDLKSRTPSFRSSELTVDFSAQEVFLGDVRLNLTPTEYKLLYHLVRNVGQTQTYSTLLARVWGREYVNEVDYVRVYIRRLRNKLGDDPERPRFIRTERGLGYRFIIPK
jgi:two-component system KDP operon response regulator KdpE